MGGESERVVFDCVIYAQALMSDTGPSAACLKLARAGHLRLFWSQYTLREIRELPSKLPRKFQLTPERIEGFIRAVASFAELVDPIPIQYVNSLDPNDSPYVDLALAADAKLIASWDHHLLSLMDSANPAGKDFLRRFPHLRILTPVQLLKRVESLRFGKT
jgi:putative PIN family toxin of toxin-antitoxin system